MNWCDHIQLPGAAFCLPNLGARAAQASGRTSTGGQAAGPPSGHKMHARVSLLLSEGTLTSLASHLTTAGAGALLSRHAKAHPVRGVWFYISNTVGQPLSWCKSAAVLRRQPSYSDCPQQVDPISIFTWDTFYSLAVHFSNRKQTPVLLMKGIFFVFLFIFLCIF